MSGGTNIGPSSSSSFGRESNSTPLWSGQAIWAGHLLDLNIFPRSRNAHLREWSRGEDARKFYGASLGALDLIVNIQILYSRPSFWHVAYSGTPFITDEVKNAFFGDASTRQSAHVFMKQTSGSSNFVTHVEASNAFVYGFAIVPVSKSEGLTLNSPLRPLVVDLKSDSVIRSGDYYSFKAWILCETSILPFFSFLTLKTESDANKLQEDLSSSVSSNPAFRIPSSNWPKYSSPSRYNFYENFGRLQSDLSGKLVENIVQKLAGPVLKPIPRYPSANETVTTMSPIPSDLEINRLREMKKKIDFSSESRFKNQHVVNEEPGKRHSHHQSSSSFISPEISHSSPMTSVPYFPSKEHNSSNYEKNNYKKEDLIRNFQTSSVGMQLPSLSPDNPWKASLSSSLNEKCLSEFVNLLFTLQEDSSQTLILLDKIIPLLISTDADHDQGLMDKVQILFQSFHKGQQTMMQGPEQVKIELQFANTLRRCPYNFKQDLATHYLKERDILITKLKKKKKERKPKKTLAETVVKTQEYRLKKKTIGVFSGNFHEKIVHFSTIILENTTLPPNSSVNAISNLYCLFIYKGINFFSWDKWRNNNVTLYSNHSKMNVCFDLEDAGKFNLSVKYIEFPTDFEDYISSKPEDCSNKKACLISFTNFYNYFQKIEKIHKVEPLITWKPIIFSRPPSTSSSSQSDLRRSKEQDPFYGLLMSVFGNRVYGLSYRKRIKLSFNFQDQLNIQYHALIFNNNIVFISEETAANFLQEIDNLIFGCDTFETFLIKNERIPTSSGASVLKIKIPITSRKVEPPRDSIGNTTNIIPSVLVKAKILSIAQLNSLEFLRKEIFDGESFIVERKQSLVTFSHTLRGHIRPDELDTLVVPPMDFRMMRKIRTIAKMRVVMRNTLIDVMVFYLISFIKSEGSELVFVENSENETMGRSIDVLVSPLNENMLRLASKSNFSSSVLLTRKDRSTWAMVTDINEPLRCIGRIIMPNAYKSIIWEALESRDMFFSDMENIRSAFSSTNKVCVIKSWERLYGINDETFNDFHVGEEFLEDWDSALDVKRPVPFFSVKEENKKVKRPGKKSKTPEEDQQIEAPKEGKKRRVEEDNSSSSSNHGTFAQQVNDVTTAMPLKKRFIRHHSRSSSNSSSSSSPPLFIDMEDNVDPPEENKSIEESDMIPKVLIHENERVKADLYLWQSNMALVERQMHNLKEQDKEEEEQVMQAIENMIHVIEQSDDTPSHSS